jgi:hypothetical protein
LSSLDDHQVASFHLSHDSRKDIVNQRIKRRIANEVVCDVYKKAFVGGDRRRERVQDIGEGWEGTVAQLVA